MRIEITAQSESRDGLITLLQKITEKLTRLPSCIGEKGRSDSEALGHWGYSWEIVPDEFEGEPR